MATPIRSKRLTEISRRRVQEKRVYNLAIMAGETRVLSPTSDSLHAHCEEIKVSSLEELKELIGIPDTIAKDRRSPAMDELRPTEPANTVRAAAFDNNAIESRAALDEVSHAAAVIDQKRLISQMFSRTIDPGLLDRDANDVERIAAVSVARAAISDYLYSNTPVPSVARGLVSAYLERRQVLVFAAVFGDISVADGATLQVNAGVLAVNANRIRLYGDGRISCQGPTTFNAHSVRGGISPIDFQITNELTGPIEPIDL